MPIYDYSCTACRHLVEVIHGINDPGPRFCPQCGADGTMRKGFTTPAVHFKGSGWAKKDRRATSSPGSSATPGSSGGPGSSSSAVPSSVETKAEQAGAPAEAAAKEPSRESSATSAAPKAAGTQAD